MNLYLNGLINYFNWRLKKVFQKTYRYVYNFFQPPFYFENIKMINDLNVRVEGDNEI